MKAKINYYFNRGTAVKRIIAITSITMMISQIVFAQDYKYQLSGCVDCFNFIAPTVFDASTISTPEIGLIVYDSVLGSFRGLNSSGKWLKISRNEVLKVVNSSQTISENDDFISVDSSGGGITIGLPSAVGIPGKVLLIKKSDPSLNSVLIDAYLAESIDGFANKTLKVQNEFIEIISDGFNWFTKNQKLNRAPTIQKFTSTAPGVPGTYTLPSNPAPIYIRVRMVGGGGGGGGAGTSAGTAATAGTASSFGTSLLVANGGSAGVINSSGGAGGTASLGSGPIGLAVSGGGGGGGSVGNSPNNSNSSGGVGGSSFYGGAGRSAGGTIATGTAGGNAATNSGSGGGGANTFTTGGFSGSGGGAGGFVDAIISNPLSSYSYIIGTGGSGGIGGGTGSATGGSGAAGYIEVTEFYQ